MAIGGIAGIIDQGRAAGLSDDDLVDVLQEHPQLGPHIKATRGALASGDLVDTLHRAATGEANPPGIAKVPLPNGYGLHDTNLPSVPDHGPINYQPGPLVQRSPAIDKSVQEGNLRDFLGNAGAGLYDQIRDGVTLAGGLTGIGGPAEALVSGSIRPALGTLAGMGTYYGVNKAGEALGFNHAITEIAAALAGARVGAKIDPEALATLKALTSRGGFARALKDHLFGAAEETATTPKTPPTYAPSTGKVTPPSTPTTPIPTPGRAVSSGVRVGPTTPIGSSTRPDATAPTVTSTGQQVTQSTSGDINNAEFYSKAPARGITQVKSDAAKLATALRTSALPIHSSQLDALVSSPQWESILSANGIKNSPQLISQLRANLQTYERLYSK